MSPTIRIDDDVYQWLKGQAVPFDDTPNTVLRRIAGLDNEMNSKDEGENLISSPRRTPVKRGSGRRLPLTTGKELIRRWRLNVRQARFHRDGHYYEHLTEFPAALCDAKGYVVFENIEKYQKCPNLHLGQQVNVEQPGIVSILGYREVDDPVL